MAKSPAPHIEEFIVTELKNWLGEAGVKFFQDLKKNHGTVSPVLSNGPIPHPVHLREGVQVRNKLRELTNSSWTAHQYDDYWTEVVEKVIDTVPL